MRSMSIWSAPMGQADGNIPPVKIPAAVLPSAVRPEGFGHLQYQRRCCRRVDRLPERTGYYLLRVKNSYMLDKVFACVLVIIFLSLCMNGLIRLYQLAALPLPAHQKLSLFTDLLKMQFHRRVTRDFRAIYAQKHLAGCRP